MTKPKPESEWKRKPKPLPIPVKPKEVIEYDDITYKLREREKALRAIWESITELTEEIVDSEDGKRAGLIVQRAGEIQEADLLQAEVKILGERRKIAYLKIHTRALEIAKSELSELVKERSQLSEVNYRAEQRKRAAVRVAAGEENRIERDEKIVGIELGFAESKARALVNQQNIQRLHNQIRRLEMELSKAEEKVKEW